MYTWCVTWCSCNCIHIPCSRSIKSQMIMRAQTQYDPNLTLWSIKSMYFLAFTLLSTRVIMGIWATSYKFVIEHRNGYKVSHIVALILVSYEIIFQDIILNPDIKLATNICLSLSKILSPTTDIILNLIAPYQNFTT